MPATTDVIFLLRLLAHFGDHRIAIDCFEEPVDVDGSPALGKGDVLLRRQVLITEENHTVVVKGALDLGKLRMAEVLRQIDPENVGAKREEKEPNIVTAQPGEAV